MILGGGGGGGGKGLNDFILPQSFRPSQEMIAEGVGGSISVNVEPCGNDSRPLPIGGGLPP